VVNPEDPSTPPTRPSSSVSGRSTRRSSPCRRVPASASLRTSSSTVGRPEAAASRLIWGHGAGVAASAAKWPCAGATGTRLTGHRRRSVHGGGATPYPSVSWMAANDGTITAASPVMNSSPVVGAERHELPAGRGRRGRPGVSPMQDRSRRTPIDAHFATTRATTARRWRPCVPSSYLLDISRAAPKAGSVRIIRSGCCGVGSGSERWFRRGVRGAMATVNSLEA